MTLKERLEAIWLDNKLRCPCHILWWSNRYLSILWTTEDTDIHYKKGRKVKLKASHRRRNAHK